jgi:hypothetical protein
MEFDPSGRVGLVVGQAGRILRSGNAGREWLSVLPPREEEGEEG